VHVARGAGSLHLRDRHRGVGAVPGYGVHGQGKRAAVLPDRVDQPAAPTAALSINFGSIRAARADDRPCGRMESPMNKLAILTFAACIASASVAHAQLTGADLDRMAAERNAE